MAKLTSAADFFAAEDLAIGSLGTVVINRNNLRKTKLENQKNREPHPSPNFLVSLLPIMMIRVLVMLPVAPPPVISIRDRNIM